LDNLAFLLPTTTIKFHLEISLLLLSIKNKPIPNRAEKERRLDKCRGKFEEERESVRMDQRVVTLLNLLRGGRVNLRDIKVDQISNRFPSSLPLTHNGLQDTLLFKVR